MLVRERDASEEAPLGGVHKPVIGMVAPAMADDHHLPSDGWRVRGPGFADRCLEHQGPWWKEFLDGAGNREKSRQTLYHVLQTHTATSRTKRGGRETMASRALGETTCSGSRATEGICRKNTLHQPTYATPRQLYHHKQHKDRHPNQLTGPTTI